MNASTAWTMIGALAAWVTLLGGVLWFAIKTQIRNAVLEGWRQVNGYYTKSAGSEITGHEIEGRLASLERAKHHA